MSIFQKHYKKRQTVTKQGRGLSDFLPLAKEIKLLIKTRFK